MTTKILTTDPGVILAETLEAMEGLEREKATYLADWKARWNNLWGEQQRLKRDILTGQGSLLGECEAEQPLEVKGA